MKSIILSDTASAGQIYSAVSDFAAPLLQNRERLILHNDQDNLILVSSNPCELVPHSILLINSDITLGIRPHLTNSHPVITYGCNPKATITASSIGESRMICCIQRALELEDMPRIIPQEFPVPIGKHPVSAYLAAICILLISFGESFLSFKN